MKIVKIALAILYIVFAAVQYNDPDPLYWILIYGVAAALIILNLFGWHNRLIIGLFIIAGAILSLQYIGGVIDYFGAGDPGAITEEMHFDRPYIELTREFFGLWIALAGLILIYFRK